MKKITNKIAAVGLGLVLMGGLLVSVTNPIPQKPDAPIVRPMIDPPGY